MTLMRLPLGGRETGAGQKGRGTYANQRIAELPSALRVTSIVSSMATGRSVTEAAPMIAMSAKSPPASFGFTAQDIW